MFCWFVTHQCKSAIIVYTSPPSLCPLSSSIPSLQVIREHQTGFPVLHRNFLPTTILQLHLIILYTIYIQIDATCLYIYRQIEIQIYLPLSPFIPLSSSLTVSKRHSLHLCLHSFPENRFIPILFFQVSYIVVQFSSVQSFSRI